MGQGGSGWAEWSNVMGRPRNEWVANKRAVIGGRKEREGGGNGWVGRKWVMGCGWAGLWQGEEWVAPAWNQALL